MSNVLKLQEVEKYAVEFSDDPRTKVGALVELNNNKSFGTNRFVNIPNEYTKEQLLENRELKLKYITHAEVDALNNSKKTNGGIIYVNYTPCIDCAKKIIESGISKVIVKKCENEEVKNRWQESWNKTIDLLKENNIDYIEE